MFHKNKRTNNLIIALIVVAAFALGMSFSGALGADYQGEFNISGPDATRDFLSVCKETNCDILSAIEELHDEVGYSSWTLSSIVVQNADIHDQLGHSSWTLPGLAAQVYNQADTVRSRLDSHYGSWSMQSLASFIYNVCR